MFNGFTIRRNMKLAEQQVVKDRSRPLKERNPALAAKRTTMLSDNAKARRQMWLNRMDLEALDE